MDKPMVRQPMLTHKICTKGSCDSCMKEGHYLIEYLCKATKESSIAYHEGEYDKWLKERNIETSREGWWSHEAFDISNITGYVLSQRGPTLYTIPPLEWTQERASVPHGVYVIFKRDESDEYMWKHELLVGAMSFITAFNSCTSIEDGKAQAQEHYEAQLLKCLEVYDVSK